ncbi:pentatricopeptide repeat-containing protein [Senna tora]|uniref:Pentatricopeptide repeat-containing protein n=1 Tax=Senna tora TaxID=362788 RepID=A0A834TC97_9FABA|nr:pentatricopeptide repeat-containing protein [Senna tora]
MPSNFDCAARENDFGYLNNSMMHPSPTMSSLELFLWMLRNGPQPTEFTFTNVLSACVHGGVMDEYNNEIIFPFKLWISWALRQESSAASIYVWDSNLNNLELLMEMVETHLEYKFGELGSTIMVFNFGICENFGAHYAVESPCGGGLVYTWLSLVSIIDGELGVSRVLLV